MPQCILLVHQLPKLALHPGPIPSVHYLLFIFLGTAGHNAFGVITFPTSQSVLNAKVYDILYSSHSPTSITLVHSKFPCMQAFSVYQ